MAPVATGTRPTTERRDPYLWLAGIATVLAIALAVRQPWSGDLAIHAATVERLRINPGHPGDPLVDADVPSPYHSPYTLLLGLVARLTGLSALTVLWLAGPPIVVLLLWGLRAFVRRFTDHRYAPALALLFVLLLWGVRDRLWSGFLSLWSLPLVLAFPSTLALALTLLWWAALDRALVGPPRWPVFLGLAALAALIALVHPFTALTATLGAAALLAHRAGQLSRTTWAAVAVSGGAAVGLVLAWPYWSFPALLRASGQLDPIHRPLYQSPWLYYGLAAVALPAVWRRWRRDPRDPLALLFAAAVVVVAIGGLTGRYALGRAWPAVLLPAQVALAVELVHRSGRWWRGATAVACLVGLAVQAGNLLVLAPAGWLTPRVRAVAHMYPAWPSTGWLRPHLKAGDVVLTPGGGTDYFAIRTVPAYGAYTIAPAWPDPFLPDEARRQADLGQLLDPATPGTTRQALLRRYHVRWVLQVAGVPAAPDGWPLVATGPRGERLYGTG